MTPKERLLAALRREDTDYAPCAPIFWSSPEQPTSAWTNHDERLEVCCRRLGLDAVVDWGLTVDQHPSVTSRTWREDVEGEPLGRLHKVIETPSGELSCTVRLTDDWPHGDDLPLVSDFVVSRIVKPWIETERDLDCLAHCWLPPERTRAQLAESIRPWRELADRWQVPIRSSIGYGLTNALSLMGAEGAPLLSITEPALLDRLAELDHRATLRRIELSAEAGVDLLSRNGFYETCDFWSPTQIARFLGARLRAELDAAHAHGLPVAYTVCTGIMPILEHLKGLPFDALFGIEPVLTGQDMTVVARELGPTTCVWGGLSSPFHLGQGNPDSVRAAVREFYELFGRRGTILAAVPSIRPYWPWPNVEAMIDEWRKVRRA